MAKCLTIPYTGEALKIFDLFHTLWTWNPNETYIHEGRVYYVNSKGYMHFYYFERRKDIDGNKVYLLIDYLLTKAAKLREVSRVSFSDRETAYNYGLALTDEATRNTAAIAGTDAPTSEETPEPVQTTTTPETEPENGTQAAKTTDMETFKKEYSRIYSHLYEHEGQPGVDAARRKYSRLFDESWEDIKDIAKAFCTITGDLLTSDRQCAAFMIALDKVGTPTAPQNAPQGTESTTDDQTPTDGAKMPYSATDGATDGKKIITDGTTPASDPRQPDGKTITGGNSITGGKNITPPRHACENAPQGVERVQAVPTTTPRHKTPSRGKYKAAHDRPPALGKICARIRVPSGALHFAGAG